METSPSGQEIDNHVGAFFRRSRVDAGQDLVAVALSTGLEASFLGRLEEGVSRASADDIYRLCRHFDVKPNDVYKGLF